jgi:hypothetical protein
MNVHWPLSVLILSVLGGRATAQVDTPRSRQVLATEDQRFAAMLRADTAALRSPLAPDLTYTHTDGEQNTKDEFLQILSSNALRYDSIVPDARATSGSSSLPPLSQVTPRCAWDREGAPPRSAFATWRYIAGPTVAGS